MVRSGAVELLLNGRVLDLLGVGELFGHASMLSGLPTGFTARTQVDTVCYRMPGRHRPSGCSAAPRRCSSSHARSLSWTAGASPAARPSVPGATPPPAHQPVAALMRRPPCSSARADRRHPRRGAADGRNTGATCAVVDLGEALGIVTDRDLRTRVVAGGLPFDAPVSEAMTAPAYTVAADRLGSEVWLDMLDRGVRHFPVLSATGRVLGVVEDTDLVAAETRSSFHLRAAIARATTTTSSPPRRATCGPPSSRCTARGRRPCTSRASTQYLSSSTP